MNGFKNRKNYYSQCQKEKIDKNKNWNKFLTKTNKIKINLVWNINENWFDKKYKLNKKIIDYGSGIKSKIYKKTIKDKGEYYGYEKDNDAKKWLKENNYYKDFWKTKEKFDIVTADNVFEHINERLREKTIKRAYKILKENGTLIITNVFVLNLSLLTHWQDSTHETKPPSPKIITCYCENTGFKTKTYLNDITKNPFDLILNLLLKKYPQQRMTIEATKKKRNQKQALATE